MLKLKVVFISLVIIFLFNIDPVRAFSKRNLYPVVLSSHLAGKADKKKQEVPDALHLLLKEFLDPKKIFQCRLCLITSIIFNFWGFFLKNAHFV